MTFLNDCCLSTIFKIKKKKKEKEKERIIGEIRIVISIISRISRLDCSHLPVMTSRPLVAESLVSPVSLCLVRHW